MDTKSYDYENNFSSVASSLRRILQTDAQTIEEKFKILEARDKLYKIMKEKDPSFKKEVATCPDMCPEKERLLREFQGRGSLFEMSNFSKNSNFNHSLAVKEYARSSADQEEPLPHDLRPVHVLSMTMSHLLHNVVDFCELSDDNVEDWYMFLWDRTRALRKELTQQGVCDLESVTLIEQCARFHIHCAERLIDQDSSIYDDKINTENLTKCLQTLKYMYKDLAKEDVKCPNEPEFVCYTLLLNLNNSSVFTELSDLSDAVMTSTPVQFALDLMTAWETRNYIKFFNLVKKTTYLNCCLLRRYFGEMRFYAVKTMIRSYCTKTYSPQIVLSRFIENLIFEGEEECLTFLSECHFNFHEVKGRTVVNFDRLLFKVPKSTLTHGRAYLFIEEKKRRPLSVVMAGGNLPPRLFENYVPQDSFSEDGLLNPDSVPLKEMVEHLLEAKSGVFESKPDSKKPTTGSNDIQNQEPKEQAFPALEKTKETISSQPSIFCVKNTGQPSSNIFGAIQPTVFGKVSESSSLFKPNSQNLFSMPSESIFKLPEGGQSTRNIFGNCNTFNVTNHNRIPVFGAEQKPFSSVSFISSSESKQPDKESNSNFPLASVVEHSAVNLQINQPDKSSREIKLMEGIRNNEMEEKNFESERFHREKEEEERKIKREEEMKKKLQEENERKEKERKEKEKREEERIRKEEQIRRELEEKKLREELEKQEKAKAEAKLLAEVLAKEEKLRRIEFEHRQLVDKKMTELKKKLRIWKTKKIFENWRMKTWSKIEERKMKEYLKEIKLKYPPVCTEKFLNGNPYGLLIPSVLTFDNRLSWRTDVANEASKKLFIFSKNLPLLKVDVILGKILEDRVRSLGVKLNPFPWKLVVSVPDDLECPSYWKSIETFVEMHFVNNFQWQFGKQKGPLYCQKGNYQMFNFNITIRRLRGSDLYEGSEKNSSATEGSNALIFFIIENGNEFTAKRLNAVLKSKPPLPKIPLIIVALNEQSKLENLEKTLELETLMESHLSKHLTVTVVDARQLVLHLIKSLSLAAVHSAPPSSLRISSLSDFLTKTWPDFFWRRVEISLSNFKVTLHDPKILIDSYNFCVQELSDIFFDSSYDQQSVLAQDFSEIQKKRPERTSNYKQNILQILERLKLYHWPEEIPKSSHQLNYRIHQYCKKVAGQDKFKTKNLKWILYRIIRRSLLWKGLDIYCNEDIHEILVNFPWIEVFQEISRVITRQLSIDFKSKHLTVMYCEEKINNFDFEPSLITKFFKVSKRKSYKKLTQAFGNEEEVDSGPCLEKDSVIYAYSVAIEREKSKRKREEYIEDSLDTLFCGPADKLIILDEEESKSFNLSQIESNFRNFNESLEKIKKIMVENSKTLMDIQNQMQSS